MFYNIYRDEVDEMEYREYMEAVKQLIDDMNEKEKTEWLFAYAKSISNQDREKFVNDLKNIKKQDTNFNKKEFDCFIDDVNNKKSIIFYDDEYYDYDYKYDFEIDYYDNDCIGYKAKYYFEIANDLLFSYCFDDAYYIYSRLFTLDIILRNEDIDENEYITFIELIEKDIVHINAIEFLKGYGYLLLLIEKDCNKFYQVMNLYYSISIDDILAYGPKEISDIDIFINKWIHYLMKMSGDKAATLLTNACLYNDDVTQLLNVCRQCYQLHPSMYKKVCQLYMKNKDYEQAKMVAKEACENIVGDLKIKAEIADLILSYDKDEYFLSIAFIYDPTVSHYFDAFLHLENTEKLKNEFITHSYIKKNNYDYKNYQNTIISLADNEKDIFYFLLGNYDCIIQKYMKRSSHNNCYRGYIMNLLLMLLKPESNTYVADKNIYSFLTSLTGYHSVDGLLFEECYQKWKKKNPIDYRKRKDYISWLTQEIENEAKIIVGGGDRRNYHWVADKIVVLGEILQNIGMVSSVEGYCEKYKKLYFSKRAFKNELNERMRLVR